MNLNLKSKSFNKLILSSKITILHFFNSKSQEKIKNKFYELSKNMEIQILELDINNPEVQNFAIDLNVKSMPTTIVITNNWDKTKFVGASPNAILDQIINQIINQTPINEEERNIIKKYYGIGFDLAGYKYNTREISQIADEYETSKVLIKSIEKKWNKKLKSNINKINIEINQINL